MTARDVHLVIGAQGNVGGALVERLRGRPTIGAYERRAFAGGYRLSLAEVADDPSLARELIAQTRPGVVYITAGMTHVDACESQPAAAMKINRDGAAALARAARDAGARVVYYSTEYVFDGADGPYAEDDAAGPISAYGRSKWEGERAVLEIDPQALVLRTTVVYGPEQVGKNFAYSLASRLTAGEVMRVPCDQVSTPTYNRDLADATVRLVDAGAAGVFHVTGAERLDRAAFALRVALAARLPAELIRPVTTTELNQAARRPLNAGLRIEKLLQTCPDVRMRSVEDAIAHWLKHPRGKPWPS